MTVRVAALCLLLLSTTLFAQSPLSPPLPLVGAPEQQFGPEAASDGTNFLAVWIDSRNLNAPTAVWAALVGPDGRVIGNDFRVFAPPGNVRVGAVAVAWTGQAYVVMWGDTTGAINLLHIDRDGKVLDSQPRQLVLGGMVPAGLAAAGDRVLLGSIAFNNVNVSVVDAAGSLIAFHLLSHTAAPVAASNGRDFLLAWSANNGFNVAQVTRDGAIGTPRFIEMRLIPAIAANGDDYLVAYADANNNLTAEVVAADGSRVAVTALPYTFLTRTSVAVAPYGNGYVVVVPRIRAQAVIPPRAFLVGRDGRFLGEIPFTSAGDAIVLASNGTDALAVWSENRGLFGIGDSEIVAERLGHPNDDALLSLAAPRQRDVKLATNGDGLLAAWWESPVAGVGELRVGRFTRAGAALDGQGIVLDSAPFAPPLAVTFDGRDYVVAWESKASAVVYTRVSPDGRVLDSAPHSLGSDTHSPDLASDGAGALLVFAQGSNIEAARIAQDGTIAIPDRVSWDGADGHPRVAWSGSTWLVVWEHTKPLLLPPGPPTGSPPSPSPPPLPSQDVRAARLTSSLQLLDPVAILVADISAYQLQPAVASNGSDFLVAWREFDAVKARRIGTDTTLGPVVTFGKGSAPSVSADYVVAWIDGTNIVFAPLTAPSLRLRLATDADQNSSVTLLGSFAAYDRVAIEAGEVPRGFLQALQVRRPRPTRR